MATKSRSCAARRRHGSACAGTPPWRCSVKPIGLAKGPHGWPRLDKRAPWNGLHGGAGMWPSCPTFRCGLFTEANADAVVAVAGIPGDDQQWLLEDPASFVELSMRDVSPDKRP